MSADLLLYVSRAIVLVTAMPVHERAHGWMAYRLGDNTAHEQGRLTWNPLAHLDVLGSLLLIFTGYGWAKPVNVDPRYFRNPRRDMALTALAGPLSNLALALAVVAVTKVLYAFLPYLREVSGLYFLFYMLNIIVYTNLYLAVFNLLPVPPLDGAKVFGAILPDKYYFTVMRYERYIALLLFILIFTGVLSRPLSVLAEWLYSLLDLITMPINWLLL